MTPLRTPFLLLVLAAGMLASGAGLRAQVVTPDMMQRRIGEIDQEMRDLEEVARKVRGDNYRVIIGGTMGDPQAIIVSPEQVESLFVTALLNGSMTTATAAQWARAFGELTREFLGSVDQELTRLREQRQRLVTALERGGQAVPPGSVSPIGVTGSVGGRWSAACSWNDDDAGAQPSTDGGTISLTFNGQGGVSGTYQGASGAYGVSGVVGLDGSANGSGAGDGWSVNWSGRFDQRGSAITGSGGLTVAISTLGGGSCTGTWGVP